MTEPDRLEPDKVATLADEDPAEPEQESAGSHDVDEHRVNEGL